MVQPINTGFLTDTTASRFAGQQLSEGLGALGKGIATGMLRREEQDRLQKEAVAKAEQQKIENDFKKAKQEADSKNNILKSLITPDMPLDQKIKVTQAVYPDYYKSVAGAVSEIAKDASNQDEITMNVLNEVSDMLANGEITSPIQLQNELSNKIKERGGRPLRKFEQESVKQEMFGLTAQKKGEGYSKGRAQAELQKPMTTEQRKNYVKVDDLSSPNYATQGELQNAIVSGEVAYLPERSRIDFQKVKGAQDVVNEMGKLSDSIFKAEGGIEAYLSQAPSLTLDNLFQKNPNARVYFDTVSGSLTPIAKGLFSEGGALAEGDVIRTRALMPNKTDTAEVAMAKINYIKRLIKNRKAAILSPILGFDLEDLRDDIDARLKKFNELNQNPSQPTNQGTGDLQADVMPPPQSIIGSKPAHTMTPEERDAEKAALKARYGL